MIEQYGRDNSNNRSECHAVIIWEPGKIGDANHPPVKAGWYHLNPELDQHHAPLPQQG